jgi:hypothetical protein
MFRNIVLKNYRYIILIQMQNKNLTLINMKFELYKTFISMLPPHSHYLSDFEKQKMPQHKYLTYSFTPKWLTEYYPESSEYHSRSMIYLNTDKMKEDDLSIEEVFEFKDKYEPLINDKINEIINKRNKVIDEMKQSGMEKIKNYDRPSLIKILGLIGGNHISSISNHKKGVIKTTTILKQIQEIVFPDLKVVN